MLKQDGALCIDFAHDNDFFSSIGPPRFEWTAGGISGE
jgi:hypothetical protein